MKSPNLLRKIPSVSDLLESPPLKGLVERVSHNTVVHGVRTVLDDLRREMQQANSEPHIPPMGELAERIARRILQGEQPALRPVINATGILLHPDLDSAPLAEEVVAALVETARSYTSVDLDLVSGGHSRHAGGAVDLLRQLTGAESALVINSHPGASFLTLSALAAGKEVLVSRGQLVERADGTRLPDTIAASGAIVREVGTTNITRADDYQSAIRPETAALLHVHLENDRHLGAAESVPLGEMARIAQAQQLPLIADLGCGALVDLSRFGGPNEPQVRVSLAAGAELVLFSDKLLGGPTCGLIVGRRDRIEQIERHPLARALRANPLTLAALAATLRLYRNADEALRHVPLLQLLRAAPDNLRTRAERLAAQMQAAAAIGSAEAVASTAQLGTARPGQELPSWAIALKPAAGSPGRLARSLRLGMPAVVGQVQRDRLLLDLRGVFAAQDAALLAAVEALGSASETDPL